MSRPPVSRLSILGFAAGFSVITAGMAQAQTRPAPKPANRRIAAAPAADHGNADTRPAAAAGARGLLSRKSDLALTDDQVRLLDVVARRYDDQDKLLRDEKARAASRAAEQKEANAILTEAQREKIREPAPGAAVPPASDQARRN